MAHHIMAEFLVMNDEGNGTTHAVDLANNLSESIDSRHDADRDDTERKNIRLAFGALVGAIAGTWGDDFMTSNVVCPESLGDYPY